MTWPRMRASKKTCYFDAASLTTQSEYLQNLKPTQERENSAPLEIKTVLKRLIESEGVGGGVYHGDWSDVALD